jgi:hypothetical protein
LVVVFGVLLTELDVPPPGDQAKVPPAILGVAVSVAVCPTQMVAFGMVNVGIPFTVTVTF